MPFFPLACGLDNGKGVLDKLEPAGRPGSGSGSLKVISEGGEGCSHASLHASMWLRPPKILVQYPAVLAPCFCTAIPLRWWSLLKVDLMQESSNLSTHCMAGFDTVWERAVCVFGRRIAAAADVDFFFSLCKLTLEKREILRSCPSMDALLNSLEAQKTRDTI